MSDKEIGRVQIRDRHQSLYVESILDEEDIFVRTRRHSATELIRIESSEDNWSSKYYYLLCSILIGSSNDLFPISMKLAIQLSGGAFMLLLLTFSVFIGLPLMYMETFFGRYTKLTNCQIYRMAPIFFGVIFAIFSLNVLYQPAHVTTETQLLVSLLKSLANPGINEKCLEENKECYDYVKRGKVNDNCKYGYISMVCERLGEIRYLMQYNYWRIYKDPVSPRYPYYQTIIAIVFTWILILLIVMKRLQVLGWIVHVAFIIHLTTLTLIFFMALANHGSITGLHALVKLDLKGFNFYQVLLVQWYSLTRLGLIIPTGYMTSSAYARFRSPIATECFIIIAFSIALTGFYLVIFFSICGVIAHAMGVDVEAVFIPDRGLYLAVVPQLLTQLQVPNFFLFAYYASLWFFETAKIALSLHMLILNLYDYFPTLKNFATYIWVTSCLFMCFASIPACGQQFQTVFRPAFLVIYLVYGLGVFITLEITMVSYFYGVSRLSDDIQFVTGQKPVRLWRIMWYLIPFIGWYSLIMMTTMMKETYYAQADNMGLRSNEYGWICAAVLFAGLGLLAIISTFMYIAIRFGLPNLLLSLLKPQYFWGPPSRQVRMQRKNFCPQSGIRSQQIYNRIKRETERAEGIHHGGLIISELSKDILLEQALTGDILNDKVFYGRIGMYSQLDYCITQEREQELDMQDNTSTQF